MKNSAQLSCGSALCNHQDESLQCWNSSFLFISVFLLPSGDLGLLQQQRPLPSETFGFQLPSVALGKTKHSGGFILSCWSRKSFNNISFVGKLLAPWLAWLWAGIATLLFPCAVRDKDGFPSLSKAVAFCTPQRLWALKELAKILADEPMDPYIVYHRHEFCVSWKTQVKIPKPCCSCALHLKRSSSVAQCC